MSVKSTYKGLHLFTRCFCFKLKCVYSDVFKNQNLALDIYNRKLDYTEMHGNSYGIMKGNINVTFTL